MRGLIIAAGFPLCILGAISAFLITYEGYTKKEWWSKKEARQEALKMAMVAFGLFAFFSLALGWILNVCL